MRGEAGTDRHWDRAQEASFLSGTRRGRPRTARPIWLSARACPGRGTGSRHSDPVSMSPSTRSLARPLCGETTQASLQRGQENLLRLPRRSNRCSDPGAWPVATPRRRAGRSRATPGSGVVGWLRKSKAAACNFSPQLLRPGPGEQEVVSAGKEEIELGAGQWLRTRCPRPSHTSSGTVRTPPRQGTLRTPSISGYRTLLSSTSPDSVHPVPYHTGRLAPRSARPAVSGKPPQGRRGTRPAPGETRCHRRPRALCRSLV